MFKKLGTNIQGHRMCVTIYVCIHVCVMHGWTPDLIPLFYQTSYILSANNSYGYNDCIKVYCECHKSFVLDVLFTCTVGRSSAKLSILARWWKMCAQRLPRWKMLWGKSVCVTLMKLRSVRHVVTVLFSAGRGAIFLEGCCTWGEEREGERERERERERVNTRGGWR